MLHKICLTAVAIACFGSSAIAEGDVVKGEQQFKKCMACHSITDTKNKIGPHLVGTMGRVSGSVEGYNYSNNLKDMKAANTLWDEALLDKYLENPKKVAPQGKMAFGGIKKPEDRADLIAFLKSKK